jgi:hypothetical protein
LFTPSVARCGADGEGDGAKSGADKEHESGDGDAHHATFRLSTVIAAQVRVPR